MIPLSIPGIFWPDHDESVIATGTIYTDAGYPRTVVTLHGDAAALAVIQKTIEQSGVVRGTITDIDAVPDAFGDSFIGPLTLYGPAGRTSYPRQDGPDVIHFEPELVLVGAGPSDSAPGFTGVIAEFDRLPMLMPGSLEVDHRPSKGPHVGLDPTLAASKFSLSVEVEQFNLTLDHWLHQRSDPYQKRDYLEFQASPRIVGEAGTSHPMTWWIEEVVNPLRDFVTLVSGVQSAITKVRLTSTDVDNNVFGEVAPIIDLVQPGHMWFRGMEREELFRFDDPPFDMTVLLANWLVVRKKYASATELMYLSSYRTSPSPEVRFMLAFQAVEAFHRIWDPDRKRWDPSHHKEIARKVKHTFDPSPEELDWIMARIGRNELAQKEWLLGVVQPLESAFAGIVKRPNIEELVATIVDTRNAIAHRLTKPSHRAILDKTGLDIMSAILRLFLESHLLAETGIAPVGQIGDLVHDTRRFKDAFSYWVPHLVHLGRI